MTNLSGGLIGLSILSGSDAATSFASFSSSLTSNVDTAAVVKARAAFTTPATTAPWQTSDPLTNPTWMQLEQIMGARSIIDTTSSADISTLPDVQATFTTYKALDKLRILSEQAAKAGTSPTDRAKLQDAFNKGLQQLQTYLGSAATDQLRLGYSQPPTQVQSIGIQSDPPLKVAGKGVTQNRTDPVAGLTGTEVLRINLSKVGKSTYVDLDLSTVNGGNPPTLDQLADALNAAINQDPPIDQATGLPLTGANGQVLSAFKSKFTVTKTDGKWGLTLNPYGVETIGLDQVGAPDAVTAAAGQAYVASPTDKDSGNTPQPVKVMRFDDVAGTTVRTVIGSVGGVDDDATAIARKQEADAAAALKTDKPASWNDDEEHQITPPTIYKQTTANAMVTDKDGYTYVVGTTTGKIGANVVDGQDDLFLTKMDSEGNIVWQHALGETGSAQGAAISLAPNGDIIVAGTVSGDFQGATSKDTNMVVTRFTANGDQSFTTSLGTLGDDSATAVTVGPDGSIYVGGKTAAGGGNAYVARLDATGKVQEKVTLPDSGGNDFVTGMAIGSSGQLLVLTREGTGSVLRSLNGASLSAAPAATMNLGNVDARSIAVSASGQIAVGGSTGTAVTGSQVNTIAGGTDGFVTRIDAGLTSASTTYIGTGASDQIDSIAFDGDDIYVGGRTRGSLTGGAGPTGTLDGFVGLVNGSTGAYTTKNQFGSSGVTTDPVRISVAQGGSATAVRALGFSRGAINPSTSTSLIAQTNLHGPVYASYTDPNTGQVQKFLTGGDSFQIAVDGKQPRTIMIDANETMDTLAAKVRAIVGDSAMVSTPKSDDGLRSLQIMGKDGHPIELIAGPSGSDALAALGIKPGKIDLPAPVGKDDPKVRPGGTYGLNLDNSYDLTTSKSAQAAVAAINKAISMIQTAYRSLYWNDTDTQIVNGTTNGSGSAYQQAQLANYKAGLARLTGISV